MSEDEKQQKQEKKLNKKLEQLKQQADEYLAGWQRAKADYDNLHKEFARQKEDYVKYANANLIMELIPILDNFNCAFNSVPEEEKDNPWVIGLQHIKKQMQDLLAEQGVEGINTVGKKFDPELHEAVDSEFADDKEEDIILKEVKAGYKLQGKVIQAAKVVVCKKNDE